MIQKKRAVPRGCSFKMTEFVPYDCGVRSNILDRNRWGLNRSQRMQIKAFICLLGILLLVILLCGKLILLMIHREDEEEFPVPTPEPHVPVIEQLINVWIMEADEEGLLIFRDGQSERFPWGEGSDLSVREQVADVELTDGMVTSVTVKADKINGRILGADEAGIEVEGYGKLPLAADYKGYRLYDSLEMCTADDLLFGYNFTDLCIENGEICAILMVKEEAMEYIRVLIRASDYSGSFHDAPVVTCDTDYIVVYGTYDNQKQEIHSAGEELELAYVSSYFESDRIRIVPDVLTGKVVFKNCSRSQGIPSYRGMMEFLKTEDGIVAINEVLLEEYLYSVVPSEMPAKYPFEALKAQAICARTYAYGHMKHAGYPEYGAHVDDSTSYQVYNNILEQESTTTAVKETYGQLLRTADGSLAGTYYYSTSCGVGSDANVWKTQAAPALTYLRAKPLSRTAFVEALATAGSAGGNETMSIGGEGSDGSGTVPAEEEGGYGSGTVSSGGEDDMASGEMSEGGYDGNSAVWESDLGERLKEEDAFAAFISAVNEDDFESGEGWYRWTYQVQELDRERMLETLQKRFAANSRLILTWKDGEYVSETIESLGDITDLYIEKRGSGGVADELVIEAGDQRIKVISEHNIRYVLNDGKTDVLRQDGSRVASTSLLPSGFFTISSGKENGNVIGYILTGGGFGHGVGMSQNGAKAMAKSGYSAGEILLYFYDNCVIENIYE